MLLLSVPAALPVYAEESETNTAKVASDLTVTCVSVTKLKLTWNAPPEEPVEEEPEPVAEVNTESEGEVSAEIPDQNTVEAAGLVESEEGTEPEEPVEPEDPLVYLIYRATAENGKYKLIGTTENTTYTDKNLKPEQAYYYYVVIEGQEAASEVVSATPFEISKITLKRKGDGTKITWKKNAYAKGYEIYRAYSKKGKKIRIKTTTKNTYTDSMAKSGKDCWYFVRAYTKQKKKTLYSAWIRDKAEAIIRVWVETGHGIDKEGKWDSGACWNGYQEAKLMIPIAQSMVTHLRNHGIYVYTDAFSGNNINLLVMLDRANKKELSCIVNIHCDWKYAVSGTLPLYKTKAQKKLAKALNVGVHDTINIPDRGLHRRTDLKTLNKAKAIAVLYETGAIRADNKLLRTKHKAYGKGLAKGLCKWLNVKW